MLLGHDRSRVNGMRKQNKMGGGMVEFGQTRKKILHFFGDFSSYIVRFTSLHYCVIAKKEILLSFVCTRVCMLYTVLCMYRLYTTCTVQFASISDCRWTNIIMERVSSDVGEHGNRRHGFVMLYTSFYSDFFLVVFSLFLFFNWKHFAVMCCLPKLCEYRNKKRWFVFIVHDTNNIHV